MSVELSAAGEPGACLGTAAEIAHLRPAIVRRATSQILSYYQSADAGHAYIPSSHAAAAVGDGSPPSSPSSSYSDSVGFGGKASDEVVFGRRNGTSDVGAGFAQQPASATLDTATHAHSHTGAVQVSTPSFASSSTSASTGTSTGRLHTLPSREFAPSSYDSHSERTVANPGQYRRRTSSRSLGAADKRRIAIVELDGGNVIGSAMDAANEHAVLSDGVDRDGATQKIARSLSNNTTASSSSSSSAYSYSYFDPQNTYANGNNGNLRARRGFAGTFALVAPPDASPSAYTDFTPPLTAPPGVHLAQYQIQPLSRNASESSSALPGTHLRSKSEASGTIGVNNAASADAKTSDTGYSTARPAHRVLANSHRVNIAGTPPRSTTMADTGRLSAEASTRTPEQHARAQAQLDAAQAQLQPIFQSPSLSQTASLSGARNGPSVSSPPATSGDQLQQQQRSESHSPRSDSSMNVAVEQSQTWASVANASYTTMATSAHAPPPPVANTYLYYQPGIHASAGPLPSPPRQIFPTCANEPPPPRPPRLHTPTLSGPALVKRSSDASIKQAEHPPAPVITPSTTSSTLVNASSDAETGKADTEELAKPRHSREGAFPINSVIVTDATPPQPVTKTEELTRRGTMDELVKDLDHAIDEAASRGHEESLPPATNGRDLQRESSTEYALSERRSALDLKRQKSRPTLELRREESRSTFRPEQQLSRSPSSNYSDDEASDISKPLPDPFTNNRQQAHMPPHDSRDESPQRPQSPHKLLDFAKRFSALPRPPSRMSLSKSLTKTNLSSENIPAERASYENAPPLPITRKNHSPKTRSAWPGAMNFGDVVTRKSPLERSLAYARKINELANYDAGLGDWVIMTRHNLTTAGTSSKRRSASPLEVRSPSERSFAFQTRHVSRGSIGSEMTFPKRADAYIATDLLSAPSQEPVPQGPPPTLPYPTLAQGVPPHLSASRSVGLGSPSVRSSSTRTAGGAGGFFASIGRKASTKRDRGPDAPPNKLLSKRAFAAAPAAPAPEPRAVQLSATPSLPGGPRAPPGRMQRAQSVIAPKTTGTSVSGHGHTLAESENEGAASRHPSTHRSPSVMAAPIARSATVPQGATGSQDIEVQLSRLADILPGARRDILAGYLTRAGGQEMLALGRYLDDEKNGLLPKN